jgi:ESCRT-I complex subunit VPS37
MKPALEALREDTARLFNEAEELKQRWGYLEEAQAMAYKVRRKLLSQ